MVREEEEEGKGGGGGKVGAQYETTSLRQVDSCCVVFCSACS